MTDLFSLLNPQPWADKALCAEVGGDLWFPDIGEDGGPAKLICASCPVQVECLQWAVDTSEQHGIYGGLSPRERQRLKRGETPRVSLEDRLARAQARRPQPKPCNWCGHSFVGRSNAVYCSEQCRKLQDRARQRRRAA